MGGTEELIYEGNFGSTWEWLAPADVVNGIAYISATDNTLNAVDMDSGDVLWEAPLGQFIGEENPSVPSCSATLCYVVGGTRLLQAINTLDGSVSWSISLDLSTDGIEAVNSRHPLITEQLIYVGVDYSDGSYRLNVYSREDGSYQNSIEFSNQIYASPVLVDDKLLFVARRDLLALDQSSLELLWRTDFTGLSQPVIAGGMAVVTIRDEEGRYVSTLWGTAGIDINSGAVMWSTEYPPDLDIGAFNPSSDGSLAYTLRPIRYGATGPGARTRGTPRAINPADGSVVWDLSEIDGSATIEPLTVPGFLFFPNARLSSSGGGLVSGVAAIDTRTGAPLWVQGGSGIHVSAATLVLVHEGEVFRTEEFPTIHE